MTPTLWSAIRSEWIKFRSVRSTLTGLLTFVVLTIGISAVVCIAVKSHWNDPGSRFDHLVFDPTSVSMTGIFLAQFAVGTIGILAITSEYGTGSMRTTLSAIPRRLRVVLAKMVVLATAIIVLGEVVVFAAFTIGQSIFKGTVPTASLSTGDVARAVIMAGVYLTLITLFAFGIGLILRTTAASIIVFTALLLIVPVIVNFLPSALQNDISKFLPSQLGSSMWAATQPTQTFAWGTSTSILALYVVAIVGVGSFLLQRRDA